MIVNDYAERPFTEADAHGKPLEGRIVVVTGAGQGVGAAVARLAAMRGAAGVVLAGRTLKKLEDVAGSLSCEALCVPADLADVDACFEVIDKAVERFGAIHMLVNAAGFTERGTIDSTSVTLFDTTFNVNVRAPFFLMQRAMPHLRKTHGTVVNIASIVSHAGPAMISAYCASKAAVGVMSKNVANAVAQDRVRVNALNMGWTATEGEHSIQTGQWHKRDENWLAQTDAEQPFGRIARAEDVARAVLFLGSPESGLMTGAVVDFEQRVIGALSEV
ncbi:MAG: SDR family oxidoreductase, partial [Pseudomonadota bacterium]